MQHYNIDTLNTPLRLSCGNCVMLCWQVGRNVDEVFRLVQAFQFADLHGEVCPEGWRPGEKSVSLGIM